ncbi:MAG TPA: Gx transporter family protein [Candidatus Rifleibacterium sp.]|nr:Gx transporter family protein [Candidatus Rifleibacterium sp.]HPT47381.1 Gx transporter family protein [Candidatus Rifleibacterium sp.]
MISNSDQDKGQGKIEAAEKFVLPPEFACNRPVALQTARYTLIAMLAAAAAALQIIESPLPRFLPWLKPGLANAMTLFAIVRVSPRAGLLVALVRTAIAAMFLGSFLSPVHLISLAGATAAALLMAGLYYLRPASGLAILSIAGALASNSAQLAAVQILFAGSLPLWFHLVAIVPVAIPSGLIVAKVTQELLRRTT